MAFTTTNGLALTVAVAVAVALQPSCVVTVTEKLYLPAMVVENVAVWVVLVNPPLLLAQL